MLPRSLAVLAIGMTAVGCTSHSDAKAPADASATAPPDTTAPTAPKELVRAASTPAPVRMVRVSVANGEVNAIEPLKWVDYAFDLPSGMCTVSGHITALAGGNKDFDAFVLNDDNFKIWINGLTPTGESSGRAQKWQFSEQVQGPGRWHLVVSNRFSELSKKVVKIWATHSCPANAS